MFKGPVADPKADGSTFHDLKSNVPEPLSMSDDRDKAEILM